MKRGATVLTPFGENCRYDLVVERNKEFNRYQCKKARLEGDVLIFSVKSYSPSNTGGTREDYHGDVDNFITHCFELSETYVVPIEEVGKKSKSLRLTPPQNNQSTGITMAEEYHIDEFFGEPNV